MLHLSQVYQSLSPLYPAPTLRKYEFPVPDAEVIDEYFPLMPHIAKSYPLKDVGALYGKMNEHTARIDVHFSEEQLLRLKASVMEDPRVQNSNVTVSIQDCLTAYVVVVLNKFSDVPIKTITNAASVSVLDLNAPKVS